MQVVGEVGQVRAAYGVVVIGRNEGERLRRCLESVVRLVGLVCYVDSGSTDNSVAMARSLGIDVVELDVRIPFTAARARNEGFRRVRELVPDLVYVQFVDGDCEVVDGWLDAACTFLDAHADIAAVCGRRRERYPERSIYNRLCDIEWNSPVGESKEALGGDAMIRIEALVAMGGYRSSLIGGEDTELGVRLRAAGWRMWRLDKEMTLHDAAMTRFSQWWKRTKRAGYATAEVASLHEAERFWAREARSPRLWGLFIPLVTLGAFFWIGTAAAALLLAYPLQVLRLSLHGDGSYRDRLWYATFLVLGKFPEMLGQAKFIAHRVFGGHSRLIEYK